MKKKAAVILLLALLLTIAVPVHAVNNHLIVSFIDVGQGDSELIQCPGGQNILVDCGDVAHGEAVVAFLKTKKIKQIDALVLTHPHTDHLGGALDVLKAIPVKRIYMPRVTANTEEYVDTLKLIKAKRIPVTEAKTGVSIPSQDGVYSVFLGPSRKDSKNLNDWSAVLSISYNLHSLLFMGDASESVEPDVLAARGAVARPITNFGEILKVGHHGSATSSSSKFLKAIKPKVAIIEVGKGNDYGHPKPSALARLRSVGATIYRTDLIGTITVTVDSGIKFSTQKKASAIQERAPSNPGVTTPPFEDGYYIGNRRSHIFHRPTCDELPAQKNRIYFKSRGAAIVAGYKPHERCQP